MFYIFLAVISFLLMVAPVRLNPLGRLLSGWSFLACLAYGFFLVGWLDDSAIQASLLRSVSFDDGIFTPQAMTAMMTIALAVFAGLPGRAPLPTFRAIAPYRFQLPLALSVTLIILALLVSLYLVYELGFSTLMSYNGYGAIKNLNERFIDNPFGKVIAGLHRPIIMLLIAETAMKYGQRKFGFVLAALIPISIAFIIGLAEGSRITALYLSIFAACCYVTGQRRVIFFLLVPIILCLAYSREARTHNILGLSYVFKYIALSLNESMLYELLVNVGMGHIITSACAELQRPENYSTLYKILSFLPSLGFIDNFPVVKFVNEQRVSTNVPFSTFGESWAFGLPYYFLLWIILFSSVKAVKSSARYGSIFFAITMAIFLFGFLIATQYPVRNSARYFYALLVVRFAIGWFMAKNSAKRGLARDLVSRRYLGHGVSH